MRITTVAYSGAEKWDEAKEGTSVRSYGFEAQVTDSTSKAVSLVF
jgi:hypothetical protein